MQYSIKNTLPFWILIAILSRLFLLSSSGIWFDEQVTLHISQGLFFYESPLQLSEYYLPLGEEFSLEYVRGLNTIQNVFHATLMDNSNSFLFNLLVHFWTVLFGTSDFSIRSISVFFYILTIPFFYTIVKKWFTSKNTTNLALAIWVLHPQLLYISQECRAYSLGILVVLIYWWLCITYSNSWKKTLFKTILFIIGMLSHYGFVVIWGVVLGIEFLYSIHKKINVKYIIVEAIVGLFVLFCWLDMALEFGLNIASDQADFYRMISSLYPNNNFHRSADIFYITEDLGRYIALLFGASYAVYGFPFWLSIIMIVIGVCYFVVLKNNILGHIMMLFIGMLILLSLCIDFTLPLAKKQTIWIVPFFIIGIVKILEWLHNSSWRKTVQGLIGLYLCALLTMCSWNYNIRFVSKPNEYQQAVKEMNSNKQIQVLTFNSKKSRQLCLPYLELFDKETILKIDTDQEVIIKAYK